MLSRFLEEVNLQMNHFVEYRAGSVYLLNLEIYFLDQRSGPIIAVSGSLRHQTYVKKFYLYLFYLLKNFFLFYASIRSASLIRYWDQK